ncbi:DUF805 domain-containing protein [Streptomyces tailanensis]|uniref:DUF805 domain-containing protein n=1 Tax=Streptomyces tailanensis TaxID=2569858 RepID=UPI00122DE62B|nr:DUF805 domain-containing protein [Streptomyces tailanensis]
MSWFFVVLKKYAVFSGRARRMEYWMFTLISSLIYFGVWALGRNIDSEIPEFVFLAAFLVPSLAVTVRRLHDTGRTGWFVLISFIPCIGTIVMLVFTATEGERGQNKYGPNPKELQTLADAG